MALKPCNSYMRLSTYDQKVLEATLIHLFRTNEICHNGLLNILQGARAAGMLSDVKFGVEEVYHKERVAEHY